MCKILMVVVTFLNAHILILLSLAMPFSTMSLDTMMLVTSQVWVDEPMGSEVICQNNNNVYMRVGDHDVAVWLEMQEKFFPLFGIINSFYIF